MAAGQTHVILEPVEFLRRLAALIPPRRFHGIRYHGLFSAASIDRAKACAFAPPVDPAHPGPGVRGHAIRTRRNDNTSSIAMTAGTSATVDADRDAPYRKRRRMQSARLLRQVFAVDILRCHCGGERKVIAALTRGQSSDALRRYLEHIAEPVDPLPISPARAPPQTVLPLGDPAAASADSSDAVDPMPNWDAYFAD